MVEAGQYVTDGTVTWIVTDVRDGTQVGDIKMSPILRKSYVKANGALLTGASVNYPRLVTFAEENPLQKLYVYDSVNDTLTTPNYEEDNPIGVIISYMGNTVPTSYLSCDGTVYNIADYQELADFINNQFGSYNYFGGDGITTFAVPDLRGEFLRGTGTNSHVMSNRDGNGTFNEGSGTYVGGHQSSTNIPNFWVWANANSALTLGVECNSINLGQNRTEANVDNVDSVLQKSNNGSAYTRYYLGGGEGNAQSNTTNAYTYAFATRPTNTSVLYLIKYTSPLIAQIKY